MYVFWSESLDFTYFVVLYQIAAMVLPRFSFMFIKLKIAAASWASINKHKIDQVQANVKFCTFILLTCFVAEFVSRIVALG